MGKVGGLSKYELMSVKEKQLIEQYIGSKGTLSPARVKKLRLYLGKIGTELGKTFDEVERKELVNYINKVNAGEEYTDSTKRDLRLIAKGFFAWHRNEEFVRGIRVGTVKETVGPEDILTDQELEGIRRACQNIRNKALIELCLL